MVRILVVLVLSSIILKSTVSFAQSPVHTATINFPINEYKFSADQVSALNAELQKLSNSPKGLPGRIVGHTDDVASLAYNDRLSAKEPGKQLNI
jgi:outer membrane protein OmpA-like peptidoglycan-associated protein